MKSKRPKSLARRNAEVEYFSIGGTKSRISPIGLWSYADKYRRSAALLPIVNSRPDIVKLFLICHSIELSLKAFLSAQGKFLIELASSEFGHDLESVLSAAKAEGILRIAELTPEQLSEIETANHYYLGKAFEYPALKESSRGFSGAPNFETLNSAASTLSASLHDHCLSASNAVDEGSS
ncbi:MAG: hypothetical protein RJQ07_01445 [Pseudomonadales bacterium]